VERGGEAFLVKADGRIRTLDEIGRATVTTRGGVAVAVRDVATVRIGGDLRTGAASENGNEVVVGTALDDRGRQQPDRRQRGRGAIGEIAKSMPPGIKVKTVLDRSKLVNATIWTVEKNLLEGALLVDRGAVLAARQYPRGTHRHAGHPDIVPDDGNGDERHRHIRQFDEPWRARLRADRRWLDHHH
jgi:Cu/Ag efflux pump CusA